MADNKKVFQIKINGITESVDAVKSLNAQLKECEGIIKNLQNAKIDVKVSAGDTTKTQKVSSGKTSESDKVSLDIEKEKTKQIEMQNEALREQYLEREQLKQSNKESLETIKQEAKGYVEVVDGVKEYSNTLNGMSAELKDIKKELRNTDVDSEAFEELTKKAADLNEKLKSAEEAYGQFGRNVGNYTQSIIDALEEWEEDKEFSINCNVSGAEGSLRDLKQQLTELKRYWADLSPDDANFDKTANAIKSLNQQIQDMESSIKSAGDEANSTFTGRFTTTIGGVEATFSNASEACEALRKKLVAMRVAGEENTPVYNEIIGLVRRLSKEVQIANKEIEGMTTMSKNIGKVVGVMKGLSGVAALGQGIAGLFGGKSEELDSVIQKFASLSLVLSGLTAIEEELNKGTSYWSKWAGKANDALNTVFSGLQKIADSSDVIRRYNDANKELANLDPMLVQTQERWGELHAEISNATRGCQEFTDICKAMFQNGGLDALDSTGLQQFDDNVNKLKADFPELSSKIDEFINLSKTEEEQQKKLQEVFQEYQTTMGQLGPVQKSFAKGLAAIGPAGKAAAVGIHATAVALKALGKALIIIGILQLLGDAIEWITDACKKGIGWIKSLFGIMDDDSAKKLANDIDNLGKKLDALSKEYDIQVKIGNMGEVEAQIQRLQDQLQNIANTKALLDAQSEMGEWMTELKNNLDTNDEAFKKLTESEKNAALAMQQLASIDPNFFIKLKGLEPEKQLEEIEKALGGDTEKIAALESLLSQSDDVLEDFLDKLSDIDWDLNDIGVEGVKAFGKILTAINQFRGQAASAVAQVKGDIASLQNQNIQLQLQLDPTNATLAFQNAISGMASMAQKYGITMSKDGLSFTAKAGDTTGAAIAKQLEENAKLQKQITDKQIADRKKADAQRAASERKSKADAAKRAAEEAKQRARNETAARLEAMKDGMDKEIAILENKRKEEIEDAKKTGKKVVDINTIYDRQILEVKKKYAKYLEDEQKAHNERLMDITKEFLTQWKEMQREIEDTKADTSMGNVENKNIKVKQSITYDTDTSGTEGVGVQKEYFNSMLEAQKQYISEKEQLEIEAAEREHKRQIEDEEARFQTQKEANQKIIDEQKEALQKKVDDAQISQEDMDKMLAELTEAYQKHDEELLQQHNDKIASITEHGETTVTNIKLQAEEERKQATIEALDNQIAVTESFYDNIEKVMERAQKAKTNDFGFIKYKDYRQTLKDALTATEETAKQIEEEKAKLQKALDNNEISFDDFKKSKKQLEDFAQEVSDKAKEIQESLKGSFQSWMSGVMENVSQYTSVLSGMFDTINEMMTRQLDAEEEALEKKQELLDKELEIIEENLEKQQEVTQEHSDKVNSIEDELKSARGDRRQALIDQLAAERKAQEASIKKEKQLTEEKKKQQQKQEQLKKQQDALDKKRKQNEKRAAIVQATINTFTAVSNALAVQPFYVGLALSAVALGLGIANVAQISSQQYADGGLLNGKSHKQGGMKIQGTNMEVEGGEMVVNKASTSANLPLLEYINSNRRTLTRDDLIRFYDNGQTSLVNHQMKTKFEEGGQLPQLSVDVKSLMDNASSQSDDKQLVVSVVDIINATENVQQVRVLAGDVDND